MLSLMRKKAGSWMIKIILALVVVVFTFWGVGSFRNRQAAVVAHVNGVPIFYEEYNRAYNNMIERLSQQFGNNLTDETIKMFQVKQQALDGIINRRLMMAEAERLGFRISDEELVESIQSIPAFQRNGRFNSDLYQRIMNQLRMTPEGFEQDQREGLLIERLRGFVAGNVKVSETEALQTYEWQDAKAAIEYLLVDPKSVKTADPTPAELETFFGEKTENYKTDPQMKVRYVRFIPKDFMGKAEVSSEEINDFFEANPDEFKSPKTVEARHILYKVEADADEATVESARERILEVLKKAKAGEDFAELAKTHSEGPSKDRGGSLGAFKKEDMVAPFAEKAFAMAVGEISDQVRTRFGWHLIKVEKINPETSKTLEEATDNIKKNLTRDKARALAYDAAEAFYDLIFEDEDLEQIAKEQNRAVQTTGFFDRKGPEEIGSSRNQFATAAFALKESAVSEIIDIDDSYYLLQAVERKPAAVPELEKVTEKVTADWKSQRQDEQAKTTAETILAELKKEGTLAAVAKKHALTIHTTDFFKRTDTIPDIGFERDISQAVFGLTDAKPLNEAVLKGQKGYYIVRLKERQAPDPNGFEERKDEIIQRLRSQKSLNVYNALLARLEAESDIERYPQFFE